MQPLGRKKTLMKNKNHPKVNGKNVAAWWEGNSMMCNTSVRMAARLQVKAEAALDYD